MHHQHDQTLSAADPRWFKSSFSGQEGGACVEGLRLPSGIAIRDSKDKAGPNLQFSTDAWNDLISSIKRGQLS